MAANPSSRKRRASREDIEPADDSLNGVLDGVLSQSDDEDEVVELESDSDGGSFSGDEDDDEGLSDESGGSGAEDSESSAVAEEETKEETLGTYMKERRDSHSRTNGDADGEDEAAAPNYKIVKDADGDMRYVYDEIDPVYDSDDSDAQQAENTIGNIPLSFYDSYPHIGYDINGKKIMRPATGEALDALLDSIEVPQGWTGLTDPATGTPMKLSQDELGLLRRVQMNEVPEDGYDPYPDMVEYFTSIEEKMPLSAAPEPKRRFLPSKHEQKRIMKLVRAIREGRLLPYKPPEEREREEEEKEEVHYDLWANEDSATRHDTLAAPKLHPPGYDASYRPPPEYLPTDAEAETWKETEAEEREKDYLPQSYDALRKVPGWDMFVKERFERCLDLYLAPRIRKNRLQIDPASLLPKLPRPEELRPFPTACQTIFRGHEGRVRSVAIDPTGCWLASGGDDGSVRVWELLTGRQVWSAKVGDDVAVNTVRWRPTKDAFVLAAAAGEEIFFAVPPVVDPELEQASRAVLDAGFGYAVNGAKPAAGEGMKEAAGKWSRPGARLEESGVLLQVAIRSPAKAISWHRRGDHFCTVSPTGQRSSVAVHTLSKHTTQVPFRKLSGLAQTALFHPSRPLFFVATQRMIRCYDLQKLELVKVIQPGARWISSMDIHPGGDNLVVGSYDRRLLWHDLDLSTRPFKTMRFHSQAIRAVRYHKGGLPLFADASDDGSLQVFHGKVGDMMENPTIVPVKMLKGHKVMANLGVMDIDFHPREAWIVSAGADGTARLWM